MANGSHGPVALVRKIVAGALGAIAVFVILFGAGLHELGDRRARARPC